MQQQLVADTMKCILGYRNKQFNCIHATAICEKWEVNNFWFLFLNIKILGQLDTEILNYEFLSLRQSVHFISLRGFISV